MQITTPSGFIVELKEKLNFGEVQELREKLFEGVKVEVGQEVKGLPEIDINNLLKYAYKAIPLLVTKITKGDSVITENIKAEVDKWESQDGDAVIDAVNKILGNTKKTDTEEKKTV